MQHTLNLPERQVTFRLKRSTRQSLGLKIKNGVLEVTAPHGVSLEFVERALTSKAAWIAKHLQPASQIFTLQHGDRIMLVGESYTLSLGEKVGVAEGVLYLPESNPKLALKQLVQQHGARWIAPKVAHWAAKVGKSPSQIKMSRARGRFGSMSNERVLNLSQGTLLLPESLLDYVIVHELCHLWHMNHSAQYWQTVQSVMPEYQKHHTALKQYGAWLEALA